MTMYLQVCLVGRTADLSTISRTYPRVSVYGGDREAGISVTLSY